MAFDCPKSSVESLIEAVLDPDVGISDHVVRVGMVLPRVGRYLPLDSGLIEARYVVRSLDPRRELFLEVPLGVESGMLITSVSFQDVLEIVNDSGVVLGLLHEVHAFHFFHICLLLNCFVQCCVARLYCCGHAGGGLCGFVAGHGRGGPPACVWHAPSRREGGEDENCNKDKDYLSSSSH